MQKKVFARVPENDQEHFSKNFWLMKSAENFLTVWSGSACISFPWGFQVFIIWMSRFRSCSGICLPVRVIPPHVGIGVSGKYPTSSLFKGSETISDWKANLNIGMEEDAAWCGQLHGGFLEKATYVNTMDILEYCMCNNILEIVITGHSQGLYLKLFPSQPYWLWF